MALQSFHASNRRFTTYILRKRDWRQNNFVVALHRDTSSGLNLLLHHYSNHCHDSYQRCEHAWRIERLRNNMSGNSHNWVNGSIVVLYSNGWPFTVLVGACVL